MLYITDYCISGQRINWALKALIVPVANLLLFWTELIHCGTYILVLAQHSLALTAAWNGAWWASYVVNEDAINLQIQLSLSLSLCHPSLHPFSQQMPVPKTRFMTSVKWKTTTKNWKDFNPIFTVFGFVYINSILENFLLAPFSKGKMCLYRHCPI